VIALWSLPYGLGQGLGKTEWAWWIISIMLATFVFYSVPVKLLMFGFVSSFDESQTNFMSLFMLGTASCGVVVMAIQVALLLTMDSS
jgi:hypothetical protein